MDIRHADVADVDAIERIAEASWEHDYPGILNREVVPDAVTEWYDDETLEAAVEDDETVLLVACEGERASNEASGNEQRAGDEAGVVGFTHAVWSDTGDEGDILRIYVHPDERGRGVGSSLLDATVEELATEGTERIRATVLAGNDLGNQFYVAAGFDRLDEQYETNIGDEYYAENAYLLGL